MNIKMSVGILAILAAVQFCSAEKFVRCNLVGYAPSAPKRVVVMAEEECAGQAWAIKNSAGTTVCAGVLGKSIFGKGEHTPFAFNYEFRFDTLKTEGSYTLEIKGAAPTVLTVKKDPYAFVLEKVLRWLRVARSGSKEVLDREPSHFGDTSCAIWHRPDTLNDQWYLDTVNPGKVNMLGGWYDAGDYLKFTHTISHTTYFLLRSYETYPEIFKKTYSTTEFVDVLDEAKFGLDYLMKTMSNTDTNEFIIQVGGEEDHNVGIRLANEDEFDGKRPAYSALSKPQMAYAAAALALGSKVFASVGRADLADAYRAKAELIYRRATSKDAMEVSAYMLADANPFYMDANPADNLELAAVELHALTGSASYLADAGKFAAEAGSAGWTSWADVNSFAHLRMLPKDPSVKEYLVEDLDGFYEKSRQKGNLWSLPMDYGWACLYSFIEVASVASEYEQVTGDRKYRSMGVNLVDYLFGLNNWGLGFVALKNVNSIQHPYSQTYRMQCEKYPEGAISEGPCDRPTHKEQGDWFGFDPSCERTFPFNTATAVFFDHKDDYVSMETIISGVSDGLYMITVASKLMAK